MASQWILLGFGMYHNQIESGPETEDWIDEKLRFIRLLGTILE